ncbi:MAG: hypothetical protein K0S23_460 [Fluviicola sp.]|jgi:hypothetical protein|nr:hypothetical protein [Fluviicola sp.]
MSKVETARRSVPYAKLFGGKLTSICATCLDVSGSVGNNENDSKLPISGSFFAFVDKCKIIHLLPW